MNDPSESWRIPLPQRRQAPSKLSSTWGWVLVSIACLVILFLPLVPLAVLLWRAVPELFSGMWQTPMVASALKLSIFTSSVATMLVILLGSPTAYVLARYRFRGVKLLDILIDLPMVLPFGYFN